MLISPFTPLFFIDRKADGRNSDYIQTFATTDRIHLQIIGAFDDVAKVYAEPSHTELFDIALSQWRINPETRLYFATLTFNPGCYSVQIGDKLSEPFIVTDNPRILEKTTLIQYSMKDNRQRTDAVFFIDGVQQFFDFRVPGGFKDSGWTFGVESEQFVTPQADIAQLYGLESTQKKFTLGHSQGCPVWFAQLLNRLLVCSHVYFDGIKYTRKESNVPELNEQLEGVNSFVFTQLLQQSINLDPVIEEANHLIMRRLSATDSSLRAITETINRKI